jgi:hypothetical protein
VNPLSVWCGLATAAGGADLGDIWMFPKVALMFSIYFPYPDFAKASQDAFPSRLAAFQKCLPYLGIIWEAFGKDLGVLWKGPHW